MLVLRNVSEIIHSEGALMKNNLSITKLVAWVLPGVWYCVSSGPPVSVSLKSPITQNQETNFLGYNTGLFLTFLVIPGV